MGMYDTINGEQVKCFPWVSLYKDEISYHGGDLKYYNTGSAVPYKRPHYNYGKNFIILDVNRYLESDYCTYDYILHVIVDGKVKDTFENEIGDIEWSINENVIGYRGEFLNIKCSEDILNYIKAQREYWAKYDKINEHWNEMFSEMMGYSHGIALLDSDSEQKKYRLQKIEEVHKLMDKEKERIRPEIDNLREEHSKWFVDTSNIDDLVFLGDYISAHETASQIDSSDNISKCEEVISMLLQNDDTLYDRYIKWYGIEPEITKEIVNNDKKKV